MEQLIRILQKSTIRLMSIFRSGLVTPRSQTSFLGYQKTFSDFISSSQASGGAQESSGPVNVDLNQLAVGQLWDEASRVTQAATAWMVPLLNLFGVEEGNGLSPFDIKINTLGDLVRFVEQFFCPPRRFTRGPNNRASRINLGENKVHDVDMEALDGALVYEDEEESPSIALPNSA